MPTMIPKPPCRIRSRKQWDNGVRRLLRNKYKPSRLLKIALADLRKVGKIRGYHVNMSQWHLHDNSGRCHICLAGAMLVGCGVTKSADLAPITFGGDISRIMQAINLLRGGFIAEALSMLNIIIEGSALYFLALPPVISVHGYDQGLSVSENKLFFEDMRFIVGILEEAGL